MIHRLARTLGTTHILYRNQRILTPGIQGCIEYGIIHQCTGGPIVLQRVALGYLSIISKILRSFIPSLSPSILGRSNNPIKRVLTVEVTYRIQHDVTLDNDRIHIHGDTFNDTTGNRGIGIEIVFLIITQCQTDGTEFFMVTQHLIQIAFVRQRTRSHMQDTILGTLVRSRHGNTFNHTITELGILLVQQQHAISSVRYRSERTGKMIEDE